MNCLKCGREIQEGNVFCQGCLQEMEKFPVHAGAVVILPRRRENPILKKVPKRHVPTAEEQIFYLRKRIRILILLLILCLALIGLMFKPTMHYVLDEHVEMGQNYSSVVTTTAPSSAE